MERSPDADRWRARCKIADEEKAKATSSCFSSAHSILPPRALGCPRGLSDSHFPKVVGSTATLRKAPRGRPLSWSAPVLLCLVWLISRLLSHHHPCTSVLSHTRHRAGGCRACFSFSLYIISRTVYSCILFHHIYTRRSPPRPPLHIHVHVPRNAMFRTTPHVHAAAPPSSAPHEPTTSPSTTLTPTLGPRPSRVPTLALPPRRPRRRGAKTTRPGSSYLFCSCPTPAITRARALHLF